MEYETLAFPQCPALHGLKTVSINQLKNKQILPSIMIMKSVFLIQMSPQDRPIFFCLIGGYMLLHGPANHETHIIIN